MKELTSEVRKAVESAALDPSISIEKSAVPAVTDRVVDRVEPIIEHFTSTEDWYRSRANWAAIISFLTPILGWIVLKVTGTEWVGVSQQDADMVALILSTIGGFVASYLARRARTATRPLGK